MKRSSPSAADPLVVALPFSSGRPRSADTISSTDSFLPAVHVIGATGVFRTDVTIFNPDPSLAAVVDLYYTEADRDGTTSPAYRIPGDLGPRASVTLPDIVLSTSDLDVELRPPRGQELSGDAGSRHEQHVQRRRRRAGNVRPVLARPALPELRRIRQLDSRRSLRHGNPERSEPPDERRRHEPDRDPARGRRPARGLRTATLYKTVLVSVPPYSLHQLNDIFNGDFASAVSAGGRPLASDRLRQPLERRAGSLLRDRHRPPHGRPLPPDRPARPPLKRQPAASPPRRPRKRPRPVRSRHHARADPGGHGRACRAPSARTSSARSSAEFDLGRLTATAFFRAAERAAGLPRLADDVWIPAWRDIFTPVPAALSALGRLEPDVVPVLVSNTNALHWEGVLRVAPELPRLVPLRALSFEVGAAKPDPAHFYAALARAGARAEDALYADDRPELVEAARTLGIDAFVVTDPDLLASELLDARFPRASSSRESAASAVRRRRVTTLREGPRGVPRGTLLRGSRGVGAALERQPRATTRSSCRASSSSRRRCVHVGRGNAAPAERLFALAREKLDRFGDQEGGINLGLLRKEIEAALALPAADLLRRQTFTF